ncbi:class I adenylate-forming enzyme family protein [Streptomyces kanamyceticus]|uniref:class I adenylate-forming enzyme family protein n=1 Tax=Streptomyces kanamyceticus TaxID=1967 RepID=UPI0037DDB762
MTEAPRTPAEEAAGTGSVHILLDRAASSRPAAPAVRDTDGAWTYAELDAAADAWAHWLTAQGVRRGERVLARLGNNRAFVALLFGALRAGAVFVPIGTAMKSFHLKRVLQDAEPALVVTAGADTELLRTFTDAPVHDVARVRLPADGEGAPTGRRVGGRTADDDLALLVYTSGSTASPKGVMSPHRTVLFATAAIADRLRYRHDDVVLNVIPFSFDYGLYQIFLTVAAGAELVLPGADSHVALVARLHEDRVTVVPVVPSLAQLLLRLVARDRRAAPPVRLFTSTGEALSGSVLRGLRTAFPSAEVAPMYGTTECKRVTILEPGEERARPHSVGRALAGTEVLVLDTAGRPLPPGETGEITVRGPHVMAGYWRAPELTRERFRPDPATGLPVLHTGDFGHLDADGYLYIQGRRDDLFKRRGVRTSALEIEAAALDVPGVRAAALLPPAEGKDMLLVVAGGLPAAEVLGRLAERLEPAKVPPACHVLPELPLTPHGKTDKQRLSTLLTGRSAG